MDLKCVARVNLKFVHHDSSIGIGTAFNFVVRRADGLDDQPALACHSSRSPSCRHTRTSGLRASPPAVRRCMCSQTTSRSPGLRLCEYRQSLAYFHRAHSFEEYQMARTHGASFGRQTSLSQNGNHSASMKLNLQRRNVSNSGFGHDRQEGASRTWVAKSAICTPT